MADLRRGGTAGRVRLQVRIDRPDSGPGHGVTVDDCAVVSRALEVWLDGSGVLGERYVLEVSSPGIDRPVKWREHWVRFAGRDVHVKIPDRGRVRATIVEVPEGTDSVLLRLTGTSEEITVPIDDAREAKLAVDW